MRQVIGLPSRGNSWGKQLWEIGLFQDIEESRVAFRELQAKGYIRYEDLPLEGKDGKRREVEFISNSYPVGDRMCIQCNIRDITERKRMERQLVEQAKQLADAHRQKDEFLAMLSHELRNPLAPIVNALYVLRLQGGENSLQQEARGIIERQIRHLTRLVNDLVGGVPHYDRQDPSSVGTGGVRRCRGTSRRDISPPDRSTLPDAICLAAQRNHLAEWRFDPARAGRWEPVGQRRQVHRRRGKYLAHARPGGTRGRAAGERYWSGNLPRSCCPTSSTSSRRRTSPLDRSEAGLGIGLALVKSLVEMHQGTIQAHSSGLKQGSEFIVRLPMLTGAPSMPLLDGHPGPALPAQITDSVRVLVVDDNTAAARMSAVLLQKFGYEVLTAHSGETALTLAMEFRPRVVLLEHRIAGNGRLRGLPVVFGCILQLKDVGLVAVTGYGQDSDRECSKEAGFDYHLVKPVEPHCLLKVLAELSARPR